MTGPSTGGPLTLTRQLPVFEESFERATLSRDHENLRFPDLDAANVASE